MTPEEQMIASIVIAVLMLIYGVILLVLPFVIFSISGTLKRIEKQLKEKGGANEARSDK